MSETQNTPLNIYHPSFRQGYWDGRQEGFQEETILTDKQFVASLFYLAENAQQWQEDGKDVQYVAGHLVGQFTTCLFPRQSAEKDAKQQEEAFLLEVKEKYGAEGEKLATLIRIHWERIDQFAQELDPETFARMLKRGAKPRRLSQRVV